MIDKILSLTGGGGSGGGGGEIPGQILIAVDITIGPNLADMMAQYGVEVIGWLVGFGVGNNGSYKFYGSSVGSASINRVLIPVCTKPEYGVDITLSDIVTSPYKRYTCCALEDGEGASIPDTELSKYGVEWDGTNMSITIDYGSPE